MAKGLPPTLLFRSLSGWQLNWLAVRRVTIRLGPRFLAREKSFRIAQASGRDQTLESCKPMVIVTRAVVGFTAVRCGFQFFRERGGPFLPRKMAFLRQLHGECEGLR